MVVQLTFDFDVQLLRSMYQKNAETMAIVLVLEIDPVILKLSRFSQVQSERERTLVYVSLALPTLSHFRGLGKGSGTLPWRSRSGLHPI